MPSSRIVYLLLLFWVSKSMLETALPPMWRYGRNGPNLLRYGRNGHSIFRYGRNDPNLIQYDKRSDVDGLYNKQAFLTQWLTNKLKTPNFFRYARTISGGDDGVSG